MADFISHFIEGELYFKRESDLCIKNIISENRQMFNWGTQGPDIFYFYKYMTKRRKPMIKIGRAMHKTDVNLLLSAMQKSILSQPCENREHLLAYLFGFIAHYHLDNRLHPYIAHIVQAEKQRGSKQTVSAIHITKECEIGRAYYRANKKIVKTKHLSFNKKFFMQKNDCAALEQMWMPVFSELFSYTLKPRVLGKCLHSCLFLSKLMFKCRFIINKSLKALGKFRNLGSIIKRQFKYDKDESLIMNTANAAWQHPEGETSQSVFELFINATEDTVKTNEALLKALSLGNVYDSQFVGNFNYGFVTCQTSI